jgi:hypothetical protein
MLSISKEQSKLKMKETLRHNQVIENLERKKIQLELNKLKQLAWKGKSQELEYKMKLMREYASLIHNGWSDGMILEMIPDMAIVVEAQKKHARGPSVARQQKQRFGYNDDDSGNEEASAPLPNAKDDGDNSDSSDKTE